MKKFFLFLTLLTLSVGQMWGASFSTTYSYGGTDWTRSGFSDESTFYKSSSSNDCVATIAGIFTNKTITSSVVITLNVACYGNGSNPTSSKFGIYNSSACTSQVTATQGGTLPSSSTYTNTTYTITQTNAANFSNDLAIKVASGTKLIRLKSIKVEFSYTAASCDKKVTITKGTPESGGSFNLDKTGAQDCCSALTVTVSNITAPSGKQFSAITQSGINSGVTIDQNAKTVTYTANTNGSSSINVTFVDLPKYTVTLMDDNDTRTQASYGAAVSLPSRAGCTGYTFAGWTKTWTSAQGSWTTTAPTIIKAGSYTPTEDENLYPVYTKTESGGDPVSVSGGNMDNGVGLTGWSTSGTGTYSGNGVKFDGANDYIQSPDLSSNNYTALTVKLKAGYNGSSGSILTIASLNASGNVIDSEDFTPNQSYTSQSTVKSIDLSGSDVIKYIRVTMKSKTSNLGMKYCEVFAAGSTTSYISVPNCCTPLGSINGSFFWPTLFSYLTC
jgi:hypothetical protein